MKTNANDKKTHLLIPIMIVLILTLFVKIPISVSQPPPPPPLVPMTIEGYVFINRTDATLITAPAGLYVYAKEGTTIINAIGDWTTNAAGYYKIGASASAEGAKIDLWVQNINVTRITFHSGTFLKLNLTVNDRTPPTIEPISPLPRAIIQANTTVWINATINDDLALNLSAIKLTLNGTELTPKFNPETGLLSYLTKPLPEALYIISIYAEDIAKNTATKTWNFTVYAPIAPTIQINNPTTNNPIYTQSGKTVQVTYTYTEKNPKNVTITVYKATRIITKVTIANLTGGTNIQRKDNITIPTGTADGNYNLNVTIFNIYNLSATATQLAAITVDSTNPVISTPYQDPPGQVVRPGEVVEVEPGYNITVKVYIIETNIDKVSLYYNISATEWKEIRMSLTVGNEYAATIPASAYRPCTTIRYYIKAVDKAGNTAQTPVAGVYFLSHIIPEYQLPTLIAMLSTTTLIAALAKKGKRTSS